MTYASIIYLEYAPYDDFARLITDTSICADEVLIRTYFCQLIDGLEYIHSQDIAHMDIKAENLLIGTDMKLKICDFDFSVNLKDSKPYNGNGTPNYRAPEVRTGKVHDLKSADIYAAGIVLFTLRCGLMPYIEDELVDGYDM
eukprot:CAMPEP_0114579802 /NCGR_PEP_ID=MMETSP0125-20121206/4161_1 /TAXON_ID=485358 ORGANISM="Aristerostoma sp., Strain ATCC 50986" /NCGR_SAMPLE_ID=MMETSP0125 /ASSEMBLY_ACC=CAM_ASM_000245 /LENGTH=141 /DNA_ID=CAMNT_0001770875 /DNA_START=319 /DNA_END=744 /DNA_ORIENTATION=+